MIKNKVVFILGAGASAPYGFPLGKKLMDNIIQNLSKPRGSHFMALQNIGKPSQISRLRKELYNSGRYSIDEFLEYRKEFLEIGKCAIALELNKYENAHGLFQSGDGDWYRYFFSMLNTSFNQFAKNNISILTYNYDRSLEYYLFTALKHSYGKTDDECANVLQKIHIVHLHGHLGYLPWEKSDGRPYGKPITDDEKYLAQAAKSIKIINEGEDITGDPEFRRASTFLKNADRIIFLGFGFHETNINRLFHDKKGKVGQINGTAMALETGEVAKAIRIFKKFGILSEFANIKTDCLTYLRQHRDWIEG